MKRWIGKDEIWMVQRIAHLTWPSAYSTILTPAQMYYMLDMMYSSASLIDQMDKGHRFYVEDREVPDGFFSVRTNGDQMKVEKIYVCPSSQGQGLGKELMLSALRLARDEGSRSVVLNVNRNNKALHFYKSLGFEIVSEVDIEIGRGYLMEDYVLEFKLG